MKGGAYQQGTLVDGKKGTQQVPVRVDDEGEDGEREALHWTWFWRPICQAPSVNSLKRLL